jgi:hypothetical protein
MPPLEGLAIGPSLLVSVLPASIEEAGRCNGPLPRGSRDFLLSVDMGISRITPKDNE